MKNRSILVKIISVFVLILSVLTPLSTSTIEYANASTSTSTLKATVNIKSGKLNVRSSKSTKNNKNIVGSLKNKASVAVYVKDITWSEIRYKKKKAYVSTKYLKFNSSTKNWVGKYTQLASGTGGGANLTVKNQTNNSFEFIITEYGREDSSGEWVYHTIDLKGKAKIKNGVGYYNKNSCKIVFDYTTKDAIYKGNAIYTDVSGSCKAGYVGDEDRKLSKEEKMGYVRDSHIKYNY